jgi:hypothetical protein
MRPEEVDKHRSSCCKVHGCAFGSKDCPVVSGEVVSESGCEKCSVDVKKPSEKVSIADATKIDLDKYIQQLVYELSEAMTRGDKERVMMLQLSIIDVRLLKMEMLFKALMKPAFISTNPLDTLRGL